REVDATGGRHRDALHLDLGARDRALGAGVEDLDLEPGRAVVDDQHGGAAGPVALARKAGDDGRGKLGDGRSAPLVLLVLEGRRRRRRKAEKERRYDGGEDADSGDAEGDTAGWMRGVGCHGSTVRAASKRPLIAR